MRYRSMTSNDVPVIFEITLTTREKSFTREGLNQAGITEASTVDRLNGVATHEGWVCEVDGAVVGFSMADKASGELWVIVVRPGFQRQGIGTELHRLALNWLKSLGWDEAWLGVLAEAQASGFEFFLHHGWKADRMNGPFSILKKSI